MGKWLMMHLRGLGYKVIPYDARQGDDPSLLGNSELVIVSVPVHLTPEIIKSSVKHMKEGSTIVEVASVKSGVYEELVKASHTGIKALCLHPMFGPSVRTLKGKTVAVIPVRDAEVEVQRASPLFPEADMVVVDANQHDRYMTRILSVPYLVNMALAATYLDTDLDLMKQLSGTSFSLQYTLTQSITGESSDLIHSLLNENKNMRNATEELISQIRELMTLTNRDNFQKHHRAIQKKMSADSFHSEAHHVMQTVSNLIKKKMTP